MGHNRDAQLRSAYEQLPKTDHADPTREEHQVRPEWVMQIIENPYDRWEEVDGAGRHSVALAGRIEGVSQWIKVVFNSEGRLITAFPDRRLAQRFGGRPWPPNQ